jgi:hypothetical protein
LELQGELRSYIWCSFGVTYISVFCTVVDLILFLSSTATVYCNLLVKFSNLRPKCLYCNGPNLWKLNCVWIKTPAAGISQWFTAGLRAG